MFDIEQLFDGLNRHDIRNRLDLFMLKMSFEIVGEGRMRRTYIAPHGRFVLKFPTNPDGIYANKYEHDTYRKYKNRPDSNGIYFAPCRLMDGFVLMMRTVERMSANDSCPEWVGYIDCEQAGYLANGKLVAYDYAG